MESSPSAPVAVARHQHLCFTAAWLATATDGCTKAASQQSLPGWRHAAQVLVRGVQLLPAVLLSLAGGHAVAATDQKPPDRLQTVQEQRNGDGSWLRLTQTETPAQGIRSLTVDLKQSATAPYLPVLQRNQSLDDAPTGGGRLVDIDGDGLLELVELEFCGAGPNCAQNILKLNPKTGRAYLWFAGGFARFQAVGQFVVASGRSSCCSWEHQVYRPPSSERSISKADLAFRIEVRAPDNEGGPARCTITRPVGANWVPFKPQQTSLLKLCEQYGEAVLINASAGQSEGLATTAIGKLAKKSPQLKSSH